IFHAGLRDREHESILLRDFLLRVAQAAQPFGTRAFHELEVVGVIDDAATVGVFPVDACAPGEYFLLACGHRSASNRGMVPPARSGTLSPKCRWALRVAMRPRAVRIRNPCWIRN